MILSRRLRLADGRSYQESTTMTMSRRDFVSGTGSCLSYLAAAGPFLSPEAWEAWGRGGRGRIVAQEAFARIEEIGAGLWAVISTPLGGDYTTLCNGGIVAGTAGTLVVEAFASPEGAAWVAERARELTGRWPTHVVVSHYHGDHSAGPAGFASGGAPPSLRATAATRTRVLESTDEETRRAPWADVELLPPDGLTEVDLGDRVVSVVPRAGHTSSDVSVEVDGGAGPIWCGDLVWNAMFPNYMDARPSRLFRSVRSLQALPASVYVPGHGPLADDDAMSRFVALIDSVESASRDAARRGITAEEAARGYQVPARLGEWTLFSPTYYQRAIQSWLDELPD